MKAHRPVNLNLFTIKFPIPAIISILHRLSGVLLFLAIPLLLWMLDQSLQSRDSFMQLQTTLALPIVKLVIWLILSAMIFHLLAGVRHLLMDMSFGESLQGGRCTAWSVTLLSIILIVLLGYWLW